MRTEMLARIVPRATRKKIAVDALYKAVRNRTLSNRPNLAQVSDLAGILRAQSAQVPQAIGDELNRLGRLIQGQGGRVQNEVKKAFLALVYGFASRSFFIFASRLRNVDSEELADSLACTLFERLQRGRNGFPRWVCRAGDGGAAAYVYVAALNMFRRHLRTIGRRHEVQPFDEGTLEGSAMRQAAFAGLIGQETSVYATELTAGLDERSLLLIGDGRNIDKAEEIGKSQGRTCTLVKEERDRIKARA